MPWTTARVLPINFTGMWVEYRYQLSTSRDKIPNYSFLTIFCNELQESSYTVAAAVLAVATSFQPCITGRLAVRQQCQWEVRPGQMGKPLDLWQSQTRNIMSLRMHLKPLSQWVEEADNGHKQEQGKSLLEFCHNSPAVCMLWPVSMFFNQESSKEKPFPII